MNKKSKLGELHHKFYNSGFNGNPIITDKELEELYNSLSEVCNYMSDRGDNSVTFCMRLELESINGMIYNRKSYE